MLVALLNDDRIYAKDAKKKDFLGNENKYFCPECGEEVFLRKGEKNIPHFAHKKTNTSCIFSKGGESLIHHMMKKRIKEIVERDNKCILSELEFKIGSRIADYYAEIKYKGKLYNVAFECVHTHMDSETFDIKSQYYSKHNVYCVWIFHLDPFLNKKTNEFKEIVNIRDIYFKAQRNNYSRIFVLGNLGEMYAIHIYKDKSFVTKFLPNFKLSGFKWQYVNKFGVSCDFLYASPYIKPFWKTYREKITQFNQNKIVYGG